jgi:hypothetical protein
MALCIALGVMFLTRNIPWWWPRNLLRWLALVWCLVPAAVPDQAGSFAPAFIIFFFEFFLQADGQPEAALRTLVMVSVAVVALVTLAAIVRWYFRAPLVTTAPGSAIETEELSDNL